MKSVRNRSVVVQDGPSLSTTTESQSKTGTSNPPSPQSEGRPFTSPSHPFQPDVEFTIVCDGAMSNRNPHQAAVGLFVYNNNVIDYCAYGNVDARNCSAYDAKLLALLEAINEANHYARGRNVQLVIGARAVRKALSTTQNVDLYKRLRSAYRGNRGNLVFTSCKRVLAGMPSKVVERLTNVTARTIEHSLYFDDDWEYLEQLAVSVPYSLL